MCGVGAGRAGSQRKLGGIRGLTRIGNDGKRFVTPPKPHIVLSSAEMSDATLRIRPADTTAPSSQETRHGFEGHLERSQDRRLVEGRLIVPFLMCRGRTALR
jgi:hypothetical protein